MRPRALGAPRQWGTAYAGGAWDPATWLDDHALPVSPGGRSQVTPAGALFAQAPVGSRTQALGPRAAPVHRCLAGASLLPGNQTSGTQMEGRKPTCLACEGKFEDVHRSRWSRTAEPLLCSLLSPCVSNDICARCVSPVNDSNVYSQEIVIAILNNSRADAVRSSPNSVSRKTRDKGQSL